MLGVAVRQTSNDAVGDKFESLRPMSYGTKLIDLDASPL